MKHVRTLTSTKKVEPVKAQDVTTLIAGAILLLAPKFFGIDPFGIGAALGITKGAS